MTQFKISNQAWNDLIEIGHYTEKHWGIEKRNQYLRTLDNCFYQIASNPGLGSNADYIHHR